MPGIAEGRQLSRWRRARPPSPRSPGPQASRIDVRPHRCPQSDCSGTELGLREQPAHRVGDLGLGGGRGQAEAGPARLDARGVVALVAAHRDHQQRQAMEERAADSPVSALAHDERHLIHQGIMRRGGHHPHVLRLRQILHVDVRPCRHDDLDIDASDGADDPLDQPGLVLRAGAAGDQHAGTRRLGPGRDVGLGPDRLIQKRPHIAVVPRQSGCLEVEGRTDGQEHPVHPIVEVEGSGQGAEPQFGTGIVEKGQEAIHQGGDPLGRRRHLRVLLGRGRWLEAAGGWRQARHRSDADMGRQHRVGHRGGLRAERAAEEDVEADHGVGRAASDLVDRVGRIGGRRSEDRPAVPIAHVGEIGRIRLAPGRRTPPRDEWESGGLDLGPHGLMRHNPHVVSGPAQLSPCREHGTEISRRAPGYAEYVKRHG